jgi:hypothetical protein
MESLLRESQYFWRKFWQKPRIPNFCEVNELWHVCASVTTVTFELAIDGFGNKRLGGVNVQ